MEIGLAVAEALAAGAIEQDPGRLVSLVKEALELMGQGREVKVHLNQALFEQLAASGELDALTAHPHLSVRPDAKSEDMGCIVESAHSRVDARVHARIEQLRHLLQEKSGGAP